MSKQKLIDEIKTRAVKRGDFTLASGRKSSYYLDLKLAYTEPSVLKAITEALREGAQGLDVDRVAGMELGAVPLAVALSLELDVPFVIIRKEKKGYGAAKRFEGEINEGENILLVEDVVTTGGSVGQAVDVIRSAGGRCSRAITVIDRLEGGEESLQKINIDLISILTIRDLEL
ncbi:orotate phosphoribosyltransferase [archaeon BMS3Abin16]|nr:orotate phosphoribosyltransferase [archaeon BMS3Abin16]HDY74261.1 orotate phosphoribosyltransferase [Euryarchaeota archaeon]